MKTVWSEKHDEYAKKDWINVPSIFAESVLDYFPSNSSVLELGAGQGQDSRFFVKNGHTVLSTDLDDTALDMSKSKITDELKDKLTTQVVDLKDVFPFDDNSFDVVYAHLSLHYFGEAKTIQIFTEINRVLKPGGVLAFLVNSTTDPEYGKGEKLENDYYQVDINAKRFFDVESARKFAVKFTPLLIDDNGETYKDTAKGVHNLIRFIGTK